MSAIEPIWHQQQRKLADLKSIMPGAVSWRDAQRTRFERSTMSELEEEVRRYGEALQELDVSLDQAQELLDD